MMDDLVVRRDKLLLAVLPHVGFDGWTRRAMDAGAADAGFDAGDALRTFPDGMKSVIAHFNDYADRQMRAELAALKLDGMPVRDKIAAAVRARLEALAPHREAVRRGLGFMMLPGRAGLAARCSYRTVDAVWDAIGDRSTDFNFYTKRALLAAVHGATALVWLNDESENCEETWAFLERRIADVLRVPKLQGRLRSAVSGLPSPFRSLRPNLNR